MKLQFSRTCTIHSGAMLTTLVVFTSFCIICIITSVYDIVETIVINECHFVPYGLLNNFTEKANAFLSETIEWMYFCNLQ